MDKWELFNRIASDFGQYILTMSPSTRPGIQNMAFNSENLYLNRAKLVMKILGIWVPSNHESVIRKFHRFIMITWQYLFLLFQTIYIIQVWGDLDAVYQATNLLVTQVCLCFKVTVLLVNMDMLKDLLRQMDSDTFQPQSETHEK